MCAIRFYVATRIVWNSNLDWNRISLKFIKGFENRKEFFSLNLLGQFSPSGPLPLFLSCSPLCLPRVQPISGPLLIPAFPSEQPTSPACLYHRPSWSRLEMNRSQGVNPCSLRNLHRIGTDFDQGRLGDRVWLAREASDWKVLQKDTLKIVNSIKSGRKP
jgi:hypothetical protein